MKKTKRGRKSIGTEPKKQVTICIDKTVLKRIDGETDNRSQYLEDSAVEKMDREK